MTHSQSRALSFCFISDNFSYAVQMSDFSGEILFLIKSSKQNIVCQKQCRKFFLRKYQHLLSLRKWKINPGFYQSLLKQAARDCNLADLGDICQIGNKVLNHAWASGYLSHLFLVPHKLSVYKSCAQQSLSHVSVHLFSLFFCPNKDQVIKFHIKVSNT